MSQAKSERLVNLLILLLHTRSYVTREQIRSTIEGYQAQSDAAFERMFERDKDELRSLGVPIETGSNDVLVDDEDGYRVRRADFELAPIDFTPAEQAVLGAAVLVWQDSAASQATAEALTTLRAAGNQVAVAGSQPLQPRIPAEAGFDELWQAILERRRVEFGYRNEPRHLEPWKLLQRRGRWYVIGFDVDRGEQRQFKLARFTAAVRPVGKPQSFEIPEQATGSSWQETNQDRAVIALASGAGGDLRRQGEPATWHQELPAGFDVVSVPIGLQRTLVGEICALGSAAIALSPPELQQAVIEQLRQVARR